MTCAATCPGCDSQCIRTFGHKGPCECPIHGYLCNDCIIYRSIPGTRAGSCKRCVIDLTEEDCIPPGHGLTDAEVEDIP